VRVRQLNPGRRVTTFYRTLSQHPRILEAAQSLARAGWTFLSNITPGQIIELADEAASSNAAELDAYFIAYYGADGGREFRVLAIRLRRRKCLEPWRDVIRECVWAYKHGRYRLVVLSLPPVIEGFV
jgi:hypothetical protein